MKKADIIVVILCVMIAVSLLLLLVTDKGKVVPAIPIIKIVNFQPAIEALQNASENHAKRITLLENKEVGNEQEILSTQADMTKLEDRIQDLEKKLKATWDLASHGKYVVGYAKDMKWEK